MTGPNANARQKTDGSAILGSLSRLPGGAQLLELAVGRDDLEIVGGAVRDLALGRSPRELDVVVAEDAAGFARELAGSLGVLAGHGPDDLMQASFHERFRTARISFEGGQIDVATRRSETYSAPGALPDVSPGSSEQDLQRRDFTVNAIAVALGGVHKGALRAAPLSLEDLESGRLRVLHLGSFHDDPTRLLRLARYRARLGFEVEPETRTLAAQAVADGALATVSGARVGAELRLALAEPDAVSALIVLGEMGLLSALDERLGLRERLARAALALLPSDGRPDLLLLACMLVGIARSPARGGAAAARALLEHLQFTAADRDRALAAALLGPELQERLRATRTPSQLREAVGAGTPEALALAGALAEQQGEAEAPAAVRRWLSEVRHVRLLITGADLLAAGIPSGPEIGRRLELTMRRKLDGELSEGREAELRAAVQAP